MLKHNKKRNTAFLFEVLVQEASKAIVEKKVQYYDQIMLMIKEHFKKGSQLSRDLMNYNSILERTSSNQKEILEESLNSFKNINKELLFKEQSALIKEMNVRLDSKIYSNFVKNYRVMGNIYHLNNSDLTPKERVELKTSILEYMKSENLDTKILQPIDNLEYRIFIDKFNKKYSHLNESQKMFLKQYMLSIHDNDTGFKIYLNEESSRLTNEINTFLQSPVPDDEIRKKLTEVKKFLSEIRADKQDTLVKILKIQELVAEFKTAG